MNDKFQALFFEEALKHIQALSEHLEAIDKKDEQDKEISEMHVHVHSLKGEANVMGYTKLGTYLTPLEKYLKNQKEVGEPVIFDKIILLKDCVQYLKSTLNNMKNTLTETDELLIKADKLYEQLGVEKGL